MAKKGFKSLVERAVRKRVALRVEPHPQRLVVVAPGRSITLRVHPLVLDTDRQTQRLLVEFIRHPRRDVQRRIQRRLISQIDAPLLRPDQQIQHGRLGRVHNLQLLYEKVNRRYFRGRVKVEAIWGRACRGKRRCSIDFGSYERSKKIIRISPALDRRWVPSFFVEYILFHEMLHAVIRFRRHGARQLLHPPEFLERERRFRFYHAATRWERANLWRFVQA